MQTHPSLSPREAASQYEKSFACLPVGREPDYLSPLLAINTQFPEGRRNLPERS